MRNAILMLFAAVTVCLAVGEAFAQGGKTCTSTCYGPPGNRTCTRNCN
jgi:hypothetical protein